MSFNNGRLSYTKEKKKAGKTGSKGDKKRKSVRCGCPALFIEGSYVCGVQIPNPSAASPPWTRSRDLPLSGCKKVLEMMMMMLLASLLVRKIGIQTSILDGIGVVGSGTGCQHSPPSIHIYIYIMILFSPGVCALGVV